MKTTISALTTYRVPRTASATRRTRRAKEAAIPLSSGPASRISGAGGLYRSRRRRPSPSSPRSKRSDPTSKRRLRVRTVLTYLYVTWWLVAFPPCRRVEATSLCRPGLPFSFWSPAGCMSFLASHVGSKTLHASEQLHLGIVGIALEL